MNDSNKQDWFKTLLVVLGSQPAIRQALGFRVRFVTSGAVRGIDLSTGIVIEDTVPAECTLRAGDDVFRRLVAGTTTMQRAHVSGELELSGDAEKLLKLYTLFDSCDRAE